MSKYSARVLALLQFLQIFDENLTEIQDYEKCLCFVNVYGTLWLLVVTNLADIVEFFALWTLSNVDVFQHWSFEIGRCSRLYSVFLMFCYKISLSKYSIHHQTEQVVLSTINFVECFLCTTNFL
jgi:hypothetical protein